MLYSVCAHAQTLYNDSALYAAYKAEDMLLWQQYIESVDFSSTSLSERQRCLCYEYGYAAAATDAGKFDADSALMRFEQHIKDLESTLPDATVLAYNSALCAYKVKAGDSYISNAFRSLRLSQQAYEADSLNPLALMMRGNVLFYAPKIAGGNKHLAQTFYERAAKVYEESGDTLWSWNYDAVKMFITKCKRY